MNRPDALTRRAMEAADAGRSSCVPDRAFGDHRVFPIVLSTDLAASRGFYHDTLGLEILREDHERIMFWCGGGVAADGQLEHDGTADTQTQLAWRVPDIEAELADLSARGVPIQECDFPDPKTEEGIADMGLAWAAWTVDPSRNVLGSFNRTISR